MGTMSTTFVMGISTDYKHWLKLAYRLYEQKTISDSFGGCSGLGLIWSKSIRDMREGAAM